MSNKKSTRHGEKTSAGYEADLLFPELVGVLKEIQRKISGRKTVV